MVVADTNRTVAPALKMEETLKKRWIPLLCGNGHQCPPQRDLFVLFR